MDEESADILFDVKNGCDEESTPTKVYAHRFILQLCAPSLADFCKEYSDLTPVPINDVKPEIFRDGILRYVYGGDVSGSLLKQHSKQIIEAADKYGVPHLKIEAEAAYVKATTITVDNAVDNFFFADTKKCALLKEYVMDFLVENGQHVLNKISFTDIPESQTMFTDFLAAVAMGKNDSKDYGGDDPTKFKTMSINALRRKLSEKGLGIDGTREMLVTVLEQSCAQSSRKTKRKRDDTDAAET